MCDNLRCKLESCVVEYGFCHCGCGEKTNICKQTWEPLGKIKGEPNLYINRHSRRMSPVEYIVNEETGCWEWQRNKSKSGYGVKTINKRTLKAHRVYYEEKYGPIPDGLFVDHICRVRHCVNPDHMELVTIAENSRRGSNTKLNWDIIKEIRLLCGKIPQKEIAKMYDICRQHVNDIINNKVWRE